MNWLKIQFPVFRSFTSVVREACLICLFTRILLKIVGYTSRTQQAMKMLTEPRLGGENCMGINSVILKKFFVCRMTKTTTSISGHAFSGCPTARFCLHLPMEATIFVLKETGFVSRHNNWTATSERF